MGSEKQLMGEIREVMERKLTEVDWSNRDLETLPEAFGKMTSVKSLNLSRNDLEVLPDAIAGLSNLEELIINSNRLAKLPDSIGALKSLRILDVSKNELTKLPESICNCSELEELTATFNKLERLPDKIATSFPKLKKLVVGLNKVLVLPLNIGELHNLQHLDVHFNRLHEVPSSVGSLQKLKYLDVSDNFVDLVALPASMGELCNLTDLNVQNNQLSELPVEFGKLTQLQRLAMEGNPWKDPPIELVDQDDHGALMSYLADRYANAQEIGHGNKLFEEWGRWISNIFGGDSAFSHWLNSVLAGMNTQQLAWNQNQNQQGPRGAILKATEMKAVKGKEEEDLEGGNRSESLPVSSQEGRVAA